MTQTVTPFLHTDLDAPTLLAYLRTFVRNGVVSGSQVSAGTSGWLLSIGAGEVLIDSSRVADDLIKLDHIDLGHTTGQERHYAIYQSYAYTNSDPPATSLFAAAAAATPPSQPIIPAGAVKLADIWIPTTATSILHADVRIVNAPPLASRQDTGELLDRLVMSVGNTQIFTDGSIIYDDGTGDLVLSQDVTVQVLVTTKAQEFGAAPSLVRGVIAAGTYPVPGTSPNRDVLLYAMVNRSTPNDALPITLKFMDRNAPNGANLTEILNPAEYTKFVCLGLVSGTRMHMPGVQGQLPQPVADERKFLQNRAAGNHVFELAEDTDIVGGLRANVADTTARDAIPADVRKVGMLVYVVNENAYYTLRGGILDGNWQIIDDDIFKGGFRVVADDAARDLIPQSKQEVGMVVYVAATGLFWKLSAIAGPPGTFVAWLSDADLTGGFRVVADQAARFAIPLSKQSQDMLVLQADTNDFYRLQTPTAAPTSAPNWRILFRAEGAESEASIYIDELGIRGSIEPGIRQREVRQSYWTARNKDGQATSRVIRGMEIVPGFAGGVPLASLGATGGVIQMPNQFVGPHTAGAINLSLGLAANFVENALPSYPSNVYIYYRRKNDGIETGTIRAAAAAPDQFGRPGGVLAGADAAYVYDDYAYLGMLRPKASPAADHEAAWGSFSVAHGYNGERSIFFDSDEPDFFGAVTPTLTTLTALIQNTGPATPPSTLFPTAITVQCHHEIRLAGTTVLADLATVIVLEVSVDGGFLRTVGVDLENQDTHWTANSSFSMSKRTARPTVKFYLIRTGGAGTRIGQHMMRYTGIVENVNTPTTISQSVYGL